MRQQTFFRHLGVTEKALRSTRQRIMRQADLARTLEADGFDRHIALELLESFKAELRSLERHRDLLLKQLGQLSPSPPARPCPVFRLVEAVDP
jgi:hypothetical protein